MNPIAFRIPLPGNLQPLEVRWYGILTATGLVLATWLCARLARRKGLDPDRVIDMVVYLAVGALIGARLVYVATNWNNYKNNLKSIVAIWEGGLSFHGAFIFGFLVLLAYCALTKISWLAYADLLVIGVPIIYVYTRLGNLMNGQDTIGRVAQYGWLYDWPQRAMSRFGTQPRHLAQVYGMIIGLILLWIMYRLYLRNRPAGYIFWSFVLWFSVLRSVLEEPFRQNPLYWVEWTNETFGLGFVTLTQWVSIPLIIIAIVALVLISRRASAQPSPQPAPA
ncbi:MAG: prolipoprotein diacylglyceryl transferase [Deinococcus sp.]|nr:prolipoprotein diacylglyceryl transferase [Deinococcus sp.]